MAGGLSRAESLPIPDRSCLDLEDPALDTWGETPGLDSTNSTGVEAFSTRTGSHRLDFSCDPGQASKVDGTDRQRFGGVWR